MPWDWLSTRRSARSGPSRGLLFRHKGKTVPRSAARSARSRSQRHSQANKRIGSAVQHVVSEKPYIDRIAIGLRPSGPAGTDAAVGAADIFDNDRLSERTSHPLGNDSP